MAKPATTKNIQDTLIEILHNMLDKMYAHGWYPSYGWEKYNELKQMFNDVQEGVEKSKVCEEKCPIMTKQVDPPWDIQRRAFQYLIAMQRVRTWYVDEWVVISMDWDMNIWSEGGTRGATIYPVVNGQTKTETGYKLI